MRGTVYVVAVDGVVRRYVMDWAVSTPDQFKQAANEHFGPEKRITGVTLEFGPIGESWGTR